MKKYLPFENITYRTKLDSDEILNRLSKIIEPKKSFRMIGIFGSKDPNRYEGRIIDSSFRMSRIIGYRNSFIPIIKGRIEKDFNGNKVVVTMRLHPAVIVFMVVWIGAIGIGGLAALTISSKSPDFEPVALIPIGMLVFAYLLTTGGFKYESVKSKKYLAELFESNIEEGK